MRPVRLPQLNYARDFARFLRLPLSGAQTRLIRDLEHQRQSRHCVRAFISDSPALSTPWLPLSALLAHYLRWLGCRINPGHRAAVVARSRRDARALAAIIHPRRTLTGASSRVDFLRGTTFHSLLLLDAHTLRATRFVGHRAAGSFNAQFSALISVLPVGSGSVALVVGKTDVHPRRPFGRAMRRRLPMTSRTDSPWILHDPGTIAPLPRPPLLSRPARGPWPVAPPARSVPVVTAAPAALAPPAALRVFPTYAGARPAA